MTRLPGQARRFQRAIRCYLVSSIQTNEVSSIEGTIEGETCSSSSPSRVISFARSGETGGSSLSAIRKRSPISAQMALECSWLIAISVGSSATIVLAGSFGQRVFKSLS